ncbi:hypothetical protein [Micromonospora sp. NPDC050495]|uniref:hypothetical protein n=1 Tax=Micromonospora sp. NPDC050495 TaxID=3154936 RepID=UPI0033F21F36
MRNVLAQLYATLVFLLTAGTMVVLLLAAGLTYKATRDPAGAAVLAVAAMWIPQQLITGSRHRRP